MKNRVTEAGFAAGVFGSQGDLAALDRTIGEQVEKGSTVCELYASALDAVSGCELVPHRVEALKTVLKRHAVRYTLHAPIAINLMDEPHFDLQRSAAVASIDLAAECGADVVVMHPGRVAPAVWVDSGPRLLAMERDALARLGDRAKAHGLRIAYENMSPNRRVIAGAEVSYALDPKELAAQLAELDHPAVVACLDVNHAQQGAVLRHFDMVEACAALAPHVGHIHYSDSVGTPSTIVWDDEGERLFFGIGDMHAPPGWGAIDFDRVAQVLSIRENTAIVIELKPNHFSHSAAETLAAAKAFGEAINGLNS
ncbi:MAG: sugar phosphate isomerase/epimerase family protein [Pseudomonadota bacterium]